MPVAGAWLAPFADDGEISNEQAFLLSAAAAALLASCAHGPAAIQPVLQARHKPLLSVDGLSFKDLNGNGQLDAFED